MKIKLFTIPNLLTLSNLLCGMIATVAILTDGDLHLAFWLLVLAAVFDFFDGFTARLLHQSSPIGLQLDSLADMVSSGVAPTAVHAHTGMAGRQFVVDGRYREALGAGSYCCWPSGRRCGWRNSTSTTRSAPSSADSLRPRRASSAPRWVCSTPKGCSRCPMKPYCSPRRRRPGS